VNCQYSECTIGKFASHAEKGLTSNLRGWITFIAGIHEQGDVILTSVSIKVARSAWLWIEPDPETQCHVATTSTAQDLRTTDCTVYNQHDWVEKKFVVWNRYVTIIGVFYRTRTNTVSFIVNNFTSPDSVFIVKKCFLKSHTSSIDFDSTWPGLHP
jgi:hypothetical protein